MSYERRSPPMPGPDLAPTLRADDERVEAGLDALDTPTPAARPLWRRAVSTVGRR